MTRPRRAIRRSRPTPTLFLRSARVGITTSATTVRDATVGLIRSLRGAGAAGHTGRDLARTGLAALTITALGLGAAGAVAATSSASNAGPEPALVTVTAPANPAFEHRDRSTSRDASRTEAASAAQRRAAELSSDRAKVSQAQRDAAIDERSREIAGAATDTTKAAQQMQDAQHRKVVPLNGYRIAARFGAVGAWARYHTGVDFSAALGTPVHSAAAGVVTHAGTGGEAGGWAGSYVVVRHEDGYSTLYAHLNPALAVTVGQKVGPGDLVGHVGLTGRTFGPHCHIELYPPGATPGDVYTAIDLFGWLTVP